MLGSITKKLPTGLLLLMVLVSCTSPKNQPLLIFEGSKSVSLHNVKGVSAFPSYYYTDGDSTVLTLSADGEHKIVRYHLESGKVLSEIPLSLFEHYNTMAINDRGRDSLFIIFNASSISQYHFHDSVFVMIDYEGNLKEIFSFRDVPVPASYNTFNSYNDRVFAPTAFQPVPYHKGKLHFSFQYFGEMSDPHFNTNHRPLGAAFNLESKKFEIYALPDRFPFIDSTTYYSINYELIRFSLSEEGEPLLGFSYSPLFYKYNTETKRFSSFKIQSSLVDTVYPIKSKNRVSSIIHQAEYHNIWYDKFRNKYYRLVKLPVSEEATPYRRNKPKYALIVTDENFVKEAEGILPDSCATFPFIITKEGIWLRNTNNKNKIQFILYQLKTKTDTKQQLDSIYRSKTKTEIANYGIKPYINNYFVMPENASITLIPVDLGCHSCAHEMTEFYTNNQNYFTDNSQYFILAGVSEFTMTPFLQSFNIKDSMPNLYIDKNGLYLYYLEEFNNPRHIVIKDGKTVEDKIYKPTETYVLQRKIKEYGE